jgi:diaminohydroxyphosphoribosylaminopyrimidine deaminase/5-amino-6-(5-phosphoribosylamino)uracil reductase
MLVSGREAFERLQAMRAETDAILIGIETALVNDPSLVVRIPSLRSRNPVRVILDGEARLPVGSALVRSVAEAPLWIVTGPEAEPETRERLAAEGAVLLASPAGSGGLDMQAVLGVLADRGITRVLAEGGARVAASLVGQGLADEVVLFRAPVVVGPDGVRALAGGALSAVERSPRYRLIEEARLGEDRMLRYERTN